MVRDNHRIASGRSTGRYLLVIALVLSVAAVSFPRFDRQDIGPIGNFTGKIDGETSFGDAIHYVNYVDYFRGKASLDDVPLPFTYRPLVPLIASTLPIESPMTSINVVNLIALYVTVLFVFLYLRRLGFEFSHAMLGCFMYSVSFPVFYMSTTGYVEACAMCLLAVGYYLIVREKWALVAVTIVVGMFVKEVMVLLIPVSAVHLISHRKGAVRTIVWSSVLAICFIAPTALIKETYGDFYWVPSIDTLLANLRLRALLSVLLSFGLPGALSLVFIAGIRRFSRTVQSALVWPLLTGLMFAFLLVIFSMLTAYTDGRFIWPASIFTIPLSLWVLRGLGWIGETSVQIIRLDGQN